MMEIWFMMVINRNRRAVDKNRAHSASYSYAQARGFPRLDKSFQLNSDLQSEQCLYLLSRLLALAASMSPLLRPREMNNRRQHEGITLIRNTGIGIIPSEERSQNGKEPPGLEELFVGHPPCWTAMQIADPQEEDGYVDDDEEGEEGDGGFHGHEEHQRGEDKPPLNAVSFMLNLSVGALTNNIKPKLSKNICGFPLSACSSVLMIWNPPGVKMMPTEIQNPP